MPFFFLTMLSNRFCFCTNYLYNLIVCGVLLVLKRTHSTDYLSVLSNAKSVSQVTSLSLLVFCSIILHVLTVFFFFTVLLSFSYYYLFLINCILSSWWIKVYKMNLKTSNQTQGKCLICKQNVKFINNILSDISYFLPFSVTESEHSRTLIRTTRIIPFPSTVLNNIWCQTIYKPFRVAFLGVSLLTSVKFVWHVSPLSQVSETPNSRLIWGMMSPNSHLDPFKREVTLSGAPTFLVPSDLQTLSFISLFPLHTWSDVDVKRCIAESFDNDSSCSSIGGEARDCGRMWSSERSSPMPTNSGENLPGLVWQCGNGASTMEFSGARFGGVWRAAALLTPANASQNERDQNDFPDENWSVSTWDSGQLSKRSRNEVLMPNCDNMGLYRTGEWCEPLLLELIGEYISAVPTVGGGVDSRGGGGVVFRFKRWRDDSSSFAHSTNLSRFAAMLLSRRSVYSFARAPVSGMEIGRLGLRSASSRSGNFIGILMAAMSAVGTVVPTSNGSRSAVKTGMSSSSAGDSGAIGLGWLSTGSWRLLPVSGLPGMIRQTDGDNLIRDAIAVVEAALQPGENSILFRLDGVSTTLTSLMMTHRSSDELGDDLGELSLVSPARDAHSGRDGASKSDVVDTC